MFLIFILNIKVLFVPIPPCFKMVRHQNCFLFLFVFYVLRHIGYVIFDTMLSSCHPSSFSGVWSRWAIVSTMYASLPVFGLWR